MIFPQVIIWDITIIFCDKLKIIYDIFKRIYIKEYILKNILRIYLFLKNKTLEKI